MKLIFLYFTKIVKYDEVQTANWASH